MCSVVVTSASSVPDGDGSDGVGVLYGAVEQLLMMAGTVPATLDKLVNAVHNRVDRRRMPTEGNTTTESSSPRSHRGVARGSGSSSRSAMLDDLYGAHDAGHATTSSVGCSGSSAGGLAAPRAAGFELRMKSQLRQLVRDTYWLSVVKRAMMAVSIQEPALDEPAVTDVALVWGPPRRPAGIVLLDPNGKSTWCSRRELRTLFNGVNGDDHTGWLNKLRREKVSVLVCIATPACPSRPTRPHLVQCVDVLVEEPTFCFVDDADDTIEVELANAFEVVGLSSDFSLHLSVPQEVTAEGIDNPPVVTTVSPDDDDGWWQVAGAGSGIARGTTSKRSKPLNWILAGSAEYVEEAKSEARSGLPNGRFSLAALDTTSTASNSNPKEQQQKMYHQWYQIGKSMPPIPVEAVTAS